MLARGWFVGENRGFYTALLGMKRHTDLKELFKTLKIFVQIIY